LFPIQTCPKEFYKDALKKAEKLIGEIDKRDTDILALVLELRAPLWSEDRDFERVEGIVLLKTKDYMNQKILT
jgi:predicted nucleic acid-binding protein